MAAGATVRAGHLRARTVPGAHMIEAAERFAAEFALGAAFHDRESSFAAEHLDKLRADRFLVATIPSGLGGGGVASVHDLLVASSRLARTDPATTIGVNMHFAIVHNLVRGWTVAVERWDERAAERLRDTLSGVVSGDVVFATAVSEPSPQDLLRPSTSAVRTTDGWHVTGRKVFATMAAHADVVNVAVTYRNGIGAERYGFAAIPTTSPGVTFEDDWDALGMRASSSGSITLDAVHVPDGMLADTCAAGEWAPELLDRYLVSGALHAAVSLGIAEGAHAEAVTRLAGHAGAALGDPHAVAELSANVIDVTAMQATLARAGDLIDRYLATFPHGDAPLAAVQAVTADVQAAKAFLNQASVRVVDRALALSGGAGYRAADPLARAWRDVRAGAFMHPTGANRVGQLLAATALGVGLA